MLYALFSVSYLWIDKFLLGSVSGILIKRISTTYAGCKISLWYDGTNWYGFGVNNFQLIYNVPGGSSHIFQVNNAAVVSINSSGLYVGSILLSYTVLGYLYNRTSDIQSQINNKLDITGGTITRGNLTLTAGNWI